MMRLTLFLFYNLVEREDADSNLSSVYRDLSFTILCVCMFALEWMLYFAGTLGAWAYRGKNEEPSG